MATCAHLFGNDQDSDSPRLVALQVLELEPGNSWAAAVVQELQPVVQQRQEKMKEEMIGLLTTVCADSMSTSYVTPAEALCCPDLMNQQVCNAGWQACVAWTGNCI
jgi:hypothetical protein